MENKTKERALNVLLSLTAYQREDELMSLDKTNKGDVERESLFHIISCNDKLWSLRESIYDFSERSIKYDVLESGICSSTKAMIQIGFNLFNGNPLKNLRDSLLCLDEKNFEIFIQAIQIRFDMI